MSALGLKHGFCIETSLAGKYATFRCKGCSPPRSLVSTTSVVAGLSMSYSAGSIKPRVKFAGEGSMHGQFTQA